MLPNCCGVVCVSSVACSSYLLQDDHDLSHALASSSVCVFFYWQWPALFQKRNKTDHRIFFWPPYMPFSIRLPTICCHMKRKLFMIPSQWWWHCYWYSYYDSEEKNTVHYSSPVCDGGPCDVTVTLLPYRTTSFSIMPDVMVSFIQCYALMTAMQKVSCSGWRYITGYARRWTFCYLY